MCLEDALKKVILFDFFGVICSEVSPVWFRRHFDESEAVAIKNDIVAKGDLGIISEDDVFTRISERTGVPAEDIRREWEESSFINGELVEYIRRLRVHAPIYLLSNAIGSFLRRILDKNELWSLFDRVFISSDLGIAKPTPEFFTKVLSHIGAEASDAVMIDDNPSNIAGASAAGVDGIIFTSNQTLKSELEKYLN